LSLTFGTVGASTVASTVIGNVSKTAWSAAATAGAGEIRRAAEG
jgi:hypothetical protein